MKRNAPSDRPENKEVSPYRPDPRTEAVKASYRQAWFLFLMILCFTVAWWYPVQSLIHRYTAGRVEAQGPRDARCFVALAFEGISDLPEEVSPGQFREHIKTLKGAGYQPVTLTEVEALLKEGTPLPRRAILITFDQSRKSSYFDARSTLRRAGWNAVMFLWTHPIVQTDPSSLRWPYIRKMLDGGLWEVGAQSHSGFSRVPSGPGDKPGNFFSTPKWLADETRYETPDEFHARLLADHTTCKNLITREARRTPTAFAFPYGDFGQYDQRAILTRRLNLDLVGKLYRLGFILGSNALNTDDSDPRRLNRLLVEPEWSAEELLARLEHAWPQPEGYSGKSLMKDPLRWLPDWGDVVFSDGKIRLSATVETTGAKAWINGSATTRNTHLRFHARIDGQIGVFLRATQDNEAYLYLGIDSVGRVWLRQKHVGMHPFTLASGKVLLPGDRPVPVDITVRDRLIFVMIDNHRPFSEALRIHGRPRSGMIGFSVWDEHPGRAWTELEDIKADPLFPAVFSWKTAPADPVDLSLWMHRNAYRYSGMSPRWLEIGHRGPLTDVGWDPGFLKTLAEVHHMELLPAVSLTSGTAFEATPPEVIAQRAHEDHSDGILLNLAGMPSAFPISQAAAWIRTLAAEMADRGMGLVLRLPSALENAGTIPSMLAQIPNTRIAAPPGKTSRTNNAAVNGQRPVLVDEVQIDSSDVDLSLYYEISNLDTDVDSTHSLEARGETLRLQGHAAFQAGDFDQAIEIWSRWMDLDPLNEQPPSLIGDGYLRQNNTEQALKYYAKSMEINPGQVSLAMRYARMLENEGREDEAVTILNRYAKIFPLLPEVALAQSEWLIRHGRRKKAVAMIREIAEEHPNDLRPLALLQKMLDSPKKRYDNFQRMLELGKIPGMENQLGMAIRDNQLHLMQEAWTLLPFLESVLKEAPPHQKPLFEELLPNPEIARENFTRQRLSNRWESSMEPEDVQNRRFFLATRPAEAEAYLRLKRSYGFSNGFIEATIDDARGFLWLYARRSDEGMIRYGFEQTGNMYLQVWQDGNLLVNENRPWNRPTDEPLTLRLEVRADGATGLVNGNPFFNAPISVPRDLNLGWWGIAPYAPYLGQAQATLQTLSAGPLPVNIALFRKQAPEDRSNYYLNRLKPFSRALSVASPPWFYQELDGTVRFDALTEREDLRIFCNYYRIRLLPAVRAAGPRIDIAGLHALAMEQHVPGFLFLMPRMPDEKWFRRVQAELMTHPLDLLVVALREEEGEADIRELSPRWGLFNGRRETMTLPLCLDPRVTGTPASPENEPCDEKAESSILYLREEALPPEPETL